MRLCMWKKKTKKTTHIMVIQQIYWIKLYKIAAMVWTFYPYCLTFDIIFKNQFWFSLAKLNKILFFASNKRNISCFQIKS